MAWPVANPIDRVYTDVGRTRRQYTQGSGAVLVTTIDTYAGGFVDGQAGAAVIVIGQLWPR